MYARGIISISLLDSFQNILIVHLSICLPSFFITPFTVYVLIHIIRHKIIIGNFETNERENWTSRVLSTYAFPRCVASRL